MFNLKNLAAAVLLTRLVSASSIPLKKRDALDDFIATERAIALEGVLANIGPDGALATNATRGVVIAGPGIINPDYRYSWTRDSAMTLQSLDEEFFLGTASLESTIEDYVYAESIRQTVYNAMGPLVPWGTGMGEPKYQINLTRFDGLWGRPQRDGPALRAIALMMYINYLIIDGQTDKARDVIWPVVKNDLAYVGEYWNETGYDLWEEVAGSSFFTIAVQYRALAQGHHIAHRLNVDCDECTSQAPQVGCFLRSSFWNATGNYITADINGGSFRSGINADPILGAMQLFDIRGSCNSLAYQPCSSRILATHKVYVDSFREIYPINAGIPANEAIATGRYPEDNYYEGNPWYITTLASAEVLYDAAAQFRRQGKITIDSISLSFFQQFYPDAKIGTYTLPPSYNSNADWGVSDFGETTWGSASNFANKAAVPFTDILTAMTNYADGFVKVVEKYTPANGSYSEQYNRTSGEQLSAWALTWSFASFITMAQRRDGQFPPSWNSQVNQGIAKTCSASPARGTYAPAVAAGAPPGSDACTVQVTFVCNTTGTGAGAYIMGNDSALGDWQPNHTPMVPVNYPLWYTITDLAPDTTYSYVYVSQNSDNYTVECQNRTVTTPSCGDGRVQISTMDHFGPTCAVITENFCNPDVNHCW